MAFVYVSGNRATKSFTVSSDAAAINVGLFVELNSSEQVKLTAANSSLVAGIIEGGDYKGKYSSGSSGSGIGSAFTQSAISSASKATVILKGSGTVVRAVTGETNVMAGTPLKVDANGAVVALVPSSTDSTAGSVRRIGYAVTTQVTSGATIDVLI